MNSLDLDTLRALARAHGLEWSDAELDAMRAEAAAAVAALAKLRALSLDGDPAVQFRMF